MSDKTMHLEKACYPRPDFIRKNWMPLNGEWEFSFPFQTEQPFPQGYANMPLPGKITVPYCYQSSLSGIGDFTHYETVYYARKFYITKEQLDGEVLLKFGAVDYQCTVWINGICIGSHTGGHTQFDFAVSSFLKPGENRIYLMAKDDNCCDRPRGKQYWKENPDRCWYTNTTGIWKSVWLEFTSKIYIQAIKLTPDIDRRCLELEIYLNSCCHGGLQTAISFGGYLKKEVTSTFDSTNYLKETISLTEEDFIDEIHYWTPETPNLYDLSLELSVSGCKTLDHVDSYFGMRKIEACNGQIMLNHKIFYQRLVLDQGYWKDSLMTPPTGEDLKKDIEWTKALGFNGARKHQKLEDPRYYYYADVLGLVVWCEMPSAYCFNDREIVSIISEWQEILKESYNHPCIIAWVPFNESWGIRNVLVEKRQQALVSAAYYLTKAYDSTRLISSNDGWEISEHTDLFCIHDYEDCESILKKRYENFAHFLLTGTPGRQALVQGNSYQGQPFLLSEYGGTAFFHTPSHEAWGYHKPAETVEEYLERISSLTKAIKALPNCCGYCFTQLTDVMQEANGLLDSSRKAKAAPEAFYTIFSE